MNTPTSGWTSLCNPENGDRSFRRNVGANLQLYARHSSEQCPMNHSRRDNLKPYSTVIPRLTSDPDNEFFG